jgi:hypothetical protein
MAMIVDKTQGIRLQLASAVPTPLHHSREAGGYYKVRSYHGGGEFFQPENAQVILQCLGEFLPRAMERSGSDGKMEIFYQHLSNGQDVCSRTAPLDSGVNVPQSEITRLNAAIAQLKAKENDPSTDPTKREIIRAFRLPCPNKDPELYRVYGTGSNRRLLVLWGVEKEAGSSLAPQEALNSVTQSKSSIPWWIWLLPVLLLLALLGFWCTQHPQSPLGWLPSDSSPSHIPASEPVGDSIKNKTADETQLGEPKKSEPAMPNAPLPPKSGEPDTAMPAAETPLGEPKKAEPNMPNAPLPAKSGKPDTTIPAAQTLSGEPKKAEPNIPSAPLPAKSGEPDTAMPAAETPLGEPKKTEPNMPSAPLPPKSGEPNTAMPAAETPLGEPKTLESKTNNHLPAKSVSGAPLPTQSPATSNESGPKMAADQASNAASPTGDIPDLMAKTLAAPNAKLIPLTAEIINARTSDTPKDGKVEMQLSAFVRDPDGNPITISKVDSWMVDGTQQLDKQGRPITTNTLPVNLTEGIHRVRLNGTAADGRPVAAEAAVNVGIAVREESTVKLKQLKQP